MEPLNEAEFWGGQPPHCPAERHGTRSAYLHGCRCPEARKASAEAQARWRKRSYLLRGKLLVPAVGAQRRCWALMRLGWSQAEIAKAGGVARITVNSISRGHYTTIKHETDLAVRRGYARLSMGEGGSNWVRSIATRNGWPPPMAWDDDELDDPLAWPDEDRMPKRVIRRTRDGELTYAAA